MTNIYAYSNNNIIFIIVSMYMCQVIMIIYIMLASSHKINNTIQFITTKTVNR